MKITVCQKYQQAHNKAVALCICSVSTEIMCNVFMVKHTGGTGRILPVSQITTIGCIDYILYSRPTTLSNAVGTHTCIQVMIMRMLSIFFVLFCAFAVIFGRDL